MSAMPQVPALTPMTSAVAWLGGLLLLLGVAAIPWGGELAGVGFLAMWSGLAMLCRGAALVRVGAGFLVAALLLAIVSFITKATTETIPTDTAPTVSAPAATPGRDIDGRFQDHTFSGRRDGTTAIATFQPKLPRSDSAFLGGASEVALTAFGEALSTGTARSVGAEILVEGSTGRTYALLPVKEDTGEIHSVRVRQLGTP